MKTFIAVASACLLIAQPAQSKMSGKGENRPSLQSDSSGSYYIRTTPTSEFGTDGTTEVYRVRANGDELLDSYGVYMRGLLYLGWSPIAGKWCVVQVEPERVTSDTDFAKFGRVSRLIFYMGGQQLVAYSRADLEAMGLRKQSTLASGMLGDFVVRGIDQIPRTNHYVFVIEKVAHQGVETISVDITTGRPFEGNGKSK